MTYKVIVSYDGKDFHGWAKQKDLRTVQEEIEKILSKIFDEKIYIFGAGRTDAFVHAYAQVFSFSTNKTWEEEKILKSLNALKPSDICFISVNKVPNNFHARFSAKEKIYEYKIFLNSYDVFKKDYFLIYDKKINLRLIKKASKKFIGKHNFLSFSTSELQNTIKKINYIKIKYKKNVLIIRISADGFLRSMVRMIVGTLLDINENKKNISDIEKLLIHNVKGSCITKARACGLYLLEVKY